MNDNLKITGIICMTIIICVALMTSCTQNTGIF
jgi:hypothetical protein